jgi:hypothetical protein
MVDLDEFWITFSDDTDLVCPAGCLGYIPVGNGDTLAEVREKAAQHLAEKHTTVLDGEVVTPRPALTAQ